MALFRQFLTPIRKNVILPNSNRSISLSAVTQLKAIVEKKEGNTLIVEGVMHDDTRKHLNVTSKTGACPICTLGVDVKHTDVLILSQFVRSDGCMLPRRITGLCRTQQKRIGIMVSMAHKAGLMPNLAPPGSKCDPKRRHDWKKFNTYFDENTIRYRL
ncbi:hypothetical protein KM043_009804 [Ampulex compressa]|nr:hypothetical protein KM043_009804 [Ampulex compressa]